MSDFFSPFRKLFLNQQFTIMIFVVVMLLLAIIYTGKILFPFFCAVVIAYLLEGIILRLRKIGSFSRFFWVNIVFLIFLVLVITIMTWALPEVISQAKQIIKDIPIYLNTGEALILKLPETYPDLINAENAKNIMTKINAEIANLSNIAFSGGFLAPIVKTLEWFIFLILVPVMIYFMLKDKHEILSYLKRLLPVDNPFLKSIWEDVNRQTGNYIRGKLTEILIVWCVSYIVFALFGLNYAMLLSFMVGISVLIPYIGATVVTLPILLVAFSQWGFTTEFLLLMLAYLIIQILDGNVLVPLIFSEAVSIHPVAIILSILLFGGLWGFWGVFFAIPLATVIKSLINAWYDSLEELEESKEALD